MRVTTEMDMKPCGCRSAGECFHNTFAEQHALDALVDQFAEPMKKKLHEARMLKFKAGWDDPEWSEADIKTQLVQHVAKGDPVDVANFAAFWWNRL